MSPLPFHEVHRCVCRGWGGEGRGGEGLLCEVLVKMAVIVTMPSLAFSWEPADVHLCVRA